MSAYRKVTEPLYRLDVGSRKLRNLRCLNPVFRSIDPRYRCFLAHNHLRRVDPSWESVKRWLLLSGWPITHDNPTYRPFDLAEWDDLRTPQNRVFTLPLCIRQISPRQDPQPIRSMRSAAQHVAQVQSGGGVRRAELREVRSEDIPLDVCHAHAEVRLRCANGSALDRHKSLETTMRYLVPATDVHDRLDRVLVPGVPKAEIPPRKSVQQEVAPAEKPLAATIDAISTASPTGCERL
jgi:hypothetical protein